jgi:hypothetical protein
MTRNPIPWEDPFLVIKPVDPRSRLSDGSRRHPSSIRQRCARLRGFVAATAAVLRELDGEAARMRQSDRRVIGGDQRHLLTNASQTGA